MTTMVPVKACGLTAGALVATATAVGARGAPSPRLRSEARRPDRPVDAPPIVLPTKLVEEHETLHLGGREIRILFPAMRSAFPSERVAMIARVYAEIEGRLP